MHRLDGYEIIHHHKVETPQTIFITVWVKGHFDIPCSRKIEGKSGPETEVTIMEPKPLLFSPELLEHDMRILERRIAA